MIPSNAHLLHSTSIPQGLHWTIAAGQALQRVSGPLHADRLLTGQCLGVKQCRAGLDRLSSGVYCFAQPRQFHWKRKIDPMALLGLRSSPTRFHCTFTRGASAPMERTAKTVETLRAEKPSRKRFRDDGTSTEHVWFYGSRGYRTCSTELCWEVSTQERFISTAVRFPDFAPQRVRQPRNVAAMAPASRQQPSDRCHDSCAFLPEGSINDHCRLPSDRRPVNGGSKD